MPETQTQPQTVTVVESSDGGTITQVTKGFATVARVPTEKILLLAVVALLGYQNYQQPKVAVAQHSETLRVMQEESERNRELRSVESQRDRNSNEIQAKLLTSSIQQLSVEMGRLQGQYGKLEGEISKLSGVIVDLKRKMPPSEDQGSNDLAPIPRAKAG